MAHDKLVCIARIGAAHGVRGEVRLWPFTQDPLGVATYGALRTADGSRSFEIADARAQKDHLVVRFRGVETREAAERLNRVELYVPRDRLPPPDADEFYHVDLIGLAAVTREGAPVGAVVAVQNFGAGDILEIAPALGGQTLLLPFTKAAVPDIDFAAGRVTVALPDEIDGDERDE